MRGLSIGAIVWLMILGSTTPVRADDDTLRWGGFFGVRVFSPDSTMGTPTRTALSNSVEVGPRLARPLRSWLIAEAELPLMITGTRDGEATVFFFEPRLHLLAERRISPTVRPFVLVGAGAPVALSSNRPRFASSMSGEGYLGAGAKLDRERGWSVRLDARIGLIPGRGDQRLAPELTINVSLYRWSPPHAHKRLLRIDELDSDADGVPDDRDECLQRPEDIDGFEDEDGCPDIDDDRDEVLDIVDRCRLEPETWNGFQDEDGCPDLVPAEVQAFSGVLEGVAFRPGSAVMTAAAHELLDRLAAMLIAHPSVRGRIVGHTDTEGDPDHNLDLSQRRAEAVKYYLVARGVAETRLGAVGVGADAPIDDNATSKGRARNRRVEFEIRRRE
ncbi:MAG TPA: OmpA family protein [Kofleriaceae bacterium]|nr:OmpA family protein [Kofleriaceae bacterium]